MAESTEEINTDKKLMDIFRDGWTLYEELEETALPTNSSEFQHKVKAAMEHFENATRIVSQIGMFSTNEIIDEVPTDSLQFMTLPYFLGKLSIKLQHDDRAEVLQVAEVYLKDYLQRCQEYELCETAKHEDSKIDKSTVNGNANELAELMRAAHSRNDKIAQFRRKRELEEFICKMRIAVRNRSVDDEVRRDFFLKLLQKSIIDAREELQSLQMERQMVEMHKMHSKSRITGGADTLDSTDMAPSGSRVSYHLHHKHGAPERKPLQPFIITRDATQKAVFGLGYPSLPIMTVNEFYDQRVRDGIFPNEEQVAQQNRAQALAAAEDPEEKEEAERAVVDQQEDEDDPEYLARRRRMDEFHDNVRRGDGNRHNRS